MAKRDNYYLLKVNIVSDTFTDTEYADRGDGMHICDVTMTHTNIKGYEAHIYKLAYNGTKTLEKFREYLKAIDAIPVPPGIPKRWETPKLVESKETFTLGDEIGDFEISKEEYNLLREGDREQFLISANSGRLRKIVPIQEDQEEIQAFVRWGQLRSCYHPREIYELADNSFELEKDSDKYILVKDLFRSLFEEE